MVRRSKICGKLFFVEKTGAAFSLQTKPFHDFLFLEFITLS